VEISFNVKVGQRWIPKKGSLFSYPLIIESVSEEDERVRFIYGETEPVITEPLRELYRYFELDHAYEATKQFDKDLEELLK